MLIGIDGNEANVTHKVGIGQYALEVLSQLSKSQVSGLQYQIYLKNAPNSEMPSESDRWKYIVVKPRKFWTQIGLPLFLYSHSPKPDVIFSPTHYAPRFSPVPTVVSIMDLAFLHYPDTFKKSDLFQLKNWTEYSVKNAAEVLTISEATKNDIIQIYGKSQDNVHVTYPGIKFSNHEKKYTMEDLRKKYKLNGQYILFVGTLQPRKNITKLFEAFKILKDNPKHNTLQLVIVGKKGWLFDEILAAPEKLAIQDSVKFLDFVSDEEMPALYENAECFVLPSLYEGFGLPVLEAMKHGAPVVTSNISSLPEAGGEAALYFDPNNPDEMAGKIAQVLEDKKLRAEMIKKGYEQTKKFSWEKTAKETLAILEKVARKD